MLFPSFAGAPNSTTNPDPTRTNINSPTQCNSGNRAGIMELQDSQGAELTFEEVIIFVTLLNGLAPKFGIMIANILTMFKIGILAVVCVAGCVILSGGSHIKNPQRNFESAFAATRSSVLSLIVYHLTEALSYQRYKKDVIYPGSFFPGPKKPKNLDSFAFVGLYHLAALQREGLCIWDSRSQSLFTSKPFLALGTADGHGIAALSGLVGHVGKHLCRVYCSMKGRRKPKTTTYYPVRLLPDGDYHVSGCDHPDVNLTALLDESTLEQSTERYNHNMLFVSEATSQKDYEQRRLETGISKPSIFSGLPHSLPVPAFFPLDGMHPILNLGDLLTSLWRGTIDCASTDDKSTWDWAVLTGDVWKEHGQAVADLREYFPGSFDTPPRNPAEKINTQYKAWEYLMYLFGVGPALLLGILPDKYYHHYCKVVRAFRLLFQEEILPEEAVEADSLLKQFFTDFEDLYCQRRVDRMHFVCPIIHTISHMPGETIRKGPLNLHSQWVMERTIGNLGEEIKQHCDPYANLAQRGIRRAQVNALKALLPELTPTEAMPRNSLDLGHGYALLHPTDSCPREVRDCEAAAIRRYIRENCDDENVNEVANSWRPNVIRWGRVHLPNGQICRSSWNENNRTTTPRRARVVKVKISTANDGSDSGDGDMPQSDLRRGFEFAEVSFYLRLNVGGIEHCLAVASFFGPPDSFLYEYSSRTHDVRAFKITDIHSCVLMGPDHQYRYFRPQDPDSAEDRWFLYEKSGLAMARMRGYFEEDADD
ncbi:hypothetical protein FB45DRAFT_1105832 [Roridomyces roridus]|uniref:Uncharacterized protein n=1 Tax=Roridomyces roridus TaxID=1738132 RepID=A0AAD7BBR9_9AGAR|nr:hypothetical protein FB45DRAFT_1105832 [Roridomyces roridus]